MNKENIEPKNKMKTAEEILKNKAQTTSNNPKFSYSEHVYWNDGMIERDVLEAMEEYANQFKPPAISSNEGETVEATNVQEGKFEALLRRHGIFEYDVRMNAVIDDLYKQWQSQHSYTEAEVLAIIELIKQKIANRAVIHCNQAFDPSCSSKWHVTTDKGLKAEFTIDKQSITDIDFKYLLK